MDAGTSTIKATIPINSKGAVSPSALAIPIIVPVNIPGAALGTTWLNTACILLAPNPNAASLMVGGTAFKEALEEIITVGRVIRVKTNPPVKGIDLGRPKKFKNIARPRRPKIIDGTAARLLMFISIKYVNLFFKIIVQNE